MASNKKKVVLPTVEEFEEVLSLLKDHFLSVDVDLDEDGGEYTDSGLYVLNNVSDVCKKVHAYLESLHPPVFKNKTVKEKVGRLGLK